MIPDLVAVIFVVPIPVEVARPVGSIVALPVIEETQVEEAVMSAVVVSE